MEILKFLKALFPSLALMNLSISGWSLFKIPILAPRLIPPCLIASVILSNIDIKLIGPDELPPVVFIKSPSGLKWAKLYPTPPPDLKIIAAAFKEFIIDSIESSTPRTKQAEPMPK